MADVMRVKWPKRWRVLIQHERKDKTEQNVDVLNFTTNFRLCSHHFDKEKISTDGYMIGDPVQQLE